MPRVTGLAASHDRYFVDGVGIGQHARYQGVSNLVIGGDGFFAFADDAALTGGAGDYAIDSLFEFAHADFAFIAPRGQDGGFVEQVGEVGAGKAGGLPGKGLQ